jgi:ParB family chromosome partitioning protein
MNTTHNTPVTSRLIEISKLEKSPLNARRTGQKTGLEELKASILAHGLMQNLVVTDAGDEGFRVIAGGRRLEAIRSLQKEGKLSEEFSVPCQIVSEEHALEMSLAENTVRLAMHPADQFEAFATLIEQGATAAEVAQRFGVEESLVHKRMKLARVAPKLLEEYRNDAMTLECLMAYTVTDDHRRQVKVFKSLQDWQKDDPNVIRACLTEKMVEAGDKLARFVGLEPYTAAGGTARADLFGNEVYLENPTLLHRLAEEQLSGIRHTLEAEGWGWVEINPDRDWNAINRCTRIQPSLVGAPAELIAIKSQLDAELEEIERALDDTESDELLDRQEAIRSRLDAVEEELAAFIGFDDEQKPLAGCWVSISHDGVPFLDKGLVKPEQRKQLAALLKSDAACGEPDRAKAKHPLPQTLRRHLAADRLQVAQVEIAKHPAIALDLLTFWMASVMIGKRPINDGPKVQMKRHDADPAHESEPSVAAEALRGIQCSLPADWLDGTSEAVRFEAFCALPEAARQELLAYCVALVLQPKLAGEGDEATAYDAALARTEAHVAGYWRPNKANYLGRITRDQLLALARDTLGEAWAQARWNVKKASLVDQLDRAFADPAKYGRTAEQAEKLKSWLPAGMEMSIATAAKPTKAKKAKKAA